MLALQMSSSPLVIVFAPPGHSPETLTTLAFGARTRNVTVRSAWTSGEFGGGVSAGGLVAGGGCPVARSENKDDKQASERRVREFMMRLRLRLGSGPERLHKCFMQRQGIKRPSVPGGHRYGWRNSTFVAACLERRRRFKLSTPTENAIAK